MIGPVLVTFVLSIVAIAAPNSFLIWHSYMLFGIQAIFTLSAIWRRLERLKDVFLPSVFTLLYFTANLTLGSYLVPREYGWDKQFATTLVYITNYNLIIPYLLLTNLILCGLALFGLRRLNQLAGLGDRRLGDGSVPDALELPQFALYFSGFVACWYYEIINAFSFQFAIMIVHLTGLITRRSPLRYFAYITYLSGFLVFSSENKREIAMALFLIVFFEAYVLDVKAKIQAKSLAIYAGTASLFFLLIIWASILRGYGDYSVKGPIDAVRYVPDYITSDVFVDGITDNLELNYNYGVAVTSIDYVISGALHYQYGTSFLKILYLPIPREVYPDKPESVLQMFTKSYAPAWWSVGGSMPVMFASEMFVNFSYIGLLVIGITIFGIDMLFVLWHMRPKGSFLAQSSIFLSLTILMLARGAGVDQYALYFFFALPVFAFHALIRGRSQVADKGHATSSAAA